MCSNMIKLITVDITTIKYGIYYKKNRKIVVYFFASLHRMSRCAHCEVSLDTLGKKLKDPEKCLIGFKVLRYDG